MTTRIAHVLVGVDLDDSSASAVRIASLLAAAFGATIVAVHADTFEMPPYFTREQLAALEKERRQTRAAVAAQVRTFVVRHVGAPVDVIVEEGPAADVILRLTHGVDLVVVGTRQLHGPKRWWFGSVAEGVVLRSPVPVVVVPPNDGDTQMPAGARILVPSDAERLVDDWARAFEDVLHGTVIRTESIATCDPARLRDADLVVLPAATSDPQHAHFDALVHVLKACTRPVLFVPAPPAGQETAP